MKELKESQRRISDELAATPDEILKAIEALTEGQLVKLQRYAKYRMRGLGRKAAGRDHEDLLTEAMTATLAGNRRWNSQAIDFFTHLVGVMRSISSHWAEQFSPQEAYLESEIFSPGSNREGSLFINEPSDVPSADRVMSAKEEVRRIEAHFASDPLIPKLLDGLKEGLTGPELQARYHLTKRAYETGMKRLRRGIAAMEEKDQAEKANPMEKGKADLPVTLTTRAGFVSPTGSQGEKYVH